MEKAVLADEETEVRQPAFYVSHIGCEDNGSDAAMGSALFVTLLPNVSKSPANRKVKTRGHHVLEINLYELTSY